jgi:NADH-quinone oxidoreductase subunit L
LKNKYYIDEIYQATFIRLATWLSDTFANFLDRQVIDGFLHAVAMAVPAIGTFLRRYIDNLIVNGFGDFVGSGTNRFGRELKVVQTGKIQQYMVVAMLFALTSLLYFLVFAR